MIQYAIYARKSDERKEVTEKSISEQVAEDRRDALAHGLHVAREYEESKSATVPGARPLYADLVKRIERGEFTGIITWKINRLVRNMEEGGKLAQLLIDGKIREIRTPHKVFTMGENILPLVLEAAMSAQYSIDLREAVTRGLNGHFERGGWNAMAHLGYRNARDDVNRKVGVVVPDGERFKMLRKGWEMMLTGAYMPSQVGDYLNSTLGFRSRRTPKRGGAPISKSSIYMVFRNPFYAGYVRYRGELRQGTHVPMVTDGEFQQVQKILRGRERTKRRTRKNDFAYTGMIRCGYCPQQATADVHTMRSGAPYVSYHCGDSYGACTKQGMSESRVEQEIVRRLESLRIGDDIREEAHRNVMSWLDREATTANGQYIERANAVAEVDAKLNRLLDMWLQGLMSDRTEYAAARKRLESERETALFDDASDRTEIDRMRIAQINVDAYVRMARPAFSAADPGRKRELATALCTSYSLFGKEKILVASVHPLLEGFVTYASGYRARDKPPMGGPGSNAPKKRSLEPTVVGSGNALSQGLATAFPFGGPDGVEAEPGKEYIELLRTSSFPDLGLR